MFDKVKIFVYCSRHFSGELDTNEKEGICGFGAIITVNEKKVEEIAGGFSNTTLVRMEIVGLIEGIKRLPNPSLITAYLSNGYIIDTLRKGWLEKWKKIGYRNKKHSDLWMMLDEAIQKGSHKITCVNAKNIKRAQYYLLAKEIGRRMTGKVNLPLDQNGNSKGENLFDSEIDSAAHQVDLVDSKPILDSIAVDASTIENPGPTEYRGVETETRKVIFEVKFEKATNNIGEFLAIVHALALFKKEGKELKIIYSDSVNAITWVKRKKCKTKFVKTEDSAKVHNAIERAIQWLETNSYDTKILKWNTAAWGEIPADYGRK